MKRSKLCYGLLLALVTIFGLSLNVSSDVNALKHEYNGIPVLSPTACFSYDSSTGHQSISYDYSDCGGSGFGLGSSFSISFEGDSYDSSYDSLTLDSSASILRFNEDGFYSSLEPMWYFGPNSSNDSYPTLGLLGTVGRDYFVSSMTNLPSYEKRRSPFGSNGFINFDTSTVPDALLVCHPFASNNYSSTAGGNGAVCNGLWNASEYLNSQVLPYFYSYDGFYLHSKAIDADGVRYSNTFSFSDLVNSYIPTFSYLDLPLFDYNGYFWDSSNLTSGRSFEFKGYFDFDGSFEWHDNISSNGSYFRLSYSAFPKYSNSAFDLYDDYVDCTTNLVTLDGLTRLEYSCPVTLEDDLVLFIPRLQISGNGNYVWKTNDEWRFAEVLLVTDHDETPGDSFNSNLTGGGEIPGDAQNDISDDNADWFASLTSLFSFDFINPFAPLFNLFNNDSCAQIPTLASMLHSNETEVCPWFDSSIRNITTPVLGLSSMMLVFGFVVRWLGSRSGNFIEDSGGVDAGGYHFGNKYRSKK